MSASFAQQLRVPILCSAFAFAIGAEVQCPGPGEAQRISLASLQAEIDALAAEVDGLTASFQIVGVTSQTYTGDLGGPWGATGKCDAEFPGSRMCTLAEARRTPAPVVAIPDEGAWTDPGLLQPDLRIADDTCGEWLSDSASAAGRVTTAAGSNQPAPMQRAASDRLLRCRALVQPRRS